MKFRKYDSRNHNRYDESCFIPMSAKTFKERYGYSFTEWKSELDKDDYRRNFKFSECYCDDDPYDQDIYGTTTPIIERTIDELYDSVCLSADEI
ncbi:hypothetical protein Lw1_gp080 [Escherichia phage Lw1]|uniref:Uncharacterized protein n=1 Tax=Escherichia phage Lw1 TaxID=1307804 RepID=M9V2G1_9CAUD|nr:hypothetical protein Lw1_gp080 [Escherichia phage Lw1]AGJ71488.1 hypothetical protein Lw1_gp080 [Escherichia phage Lw1]